MAIYAPNFLPNRPKNDAVFEFSELPKARGKKILAIYATNFCQVDPKMIRFLYSASAEGASEENLAICATNCLPNRPENDAVFKFRERRGLERRKFGDLMRSNFCQVDPKMIRFLNSVSAKGASEENFGDMMQGLSAKLTLK